MANLETESPIGVIFAEIGFPGCITDAHLAESEGLKDEGVSWES